MNKTISIIRIAILTAMFFVGLFLLLGEEEDKNFFLRFIVDKAAAFTLFYYFWRLYKRWSKIDPWLMAYNKMCGDVMDKPSKL